MSANRFANAGPIMAGLAASCQMVDSTFAGIPVVRENRTTDVASSELTRMISQIADQLSEVAAQLVSVRERLDRLEQPIAPEPRYNQMPFTFTGPIDDSEVRFISGGREGVLTELEEGDGVVKVGAWRWA